MDWILSAVEEMRAGPLDTGPEIRIPSVPPDLFEVRIAPGQARASLNLLTRALTRKVGNERKSLIAGLAQLVVHLICNQGVAGSNPAAGTNQITAKQALKPPLRGG